MQIATLPIGVTINKGIEIWGVKSDSFNQQSSLLFGQRETKNEKMSAFAGYWQYDPFTPINSGHWEKFKIPFFNPKEKIAPYCSYAKHVSFHPQL